MTSQREHMTPSEEVEHLDTTINALTKRRDELKAEISQAEHDAEEAALVARVVNHGHATPVVDCMWCTLAAELDQPGEPT